MLHVAKVNAVTPETFEAIYTTTGLKVDFMLGLFNVCTAKIVQIRDLLASENNRGDLSFKDLDWRLNLVSATRQKQKMLQPKYTVKLDLEQFPEKSNNPKEITQQSMVFDIDYVSLKRLQEEI